MGKSKFTETAEVQQKFKSILNQNPRNDSGSNRESLYLSVQQMYIKCLPVLNDGHTEVNKNNALALLMLIF